MEYEMSLDIDGTLKQRLVVKSLVPGDKVYRNLYGDYMPGEVTKVSPTGQVTVKYRFGGPDVFLPSARLRGNAAISIDDRMTFDERTEWLRRMKLAAESRSAVVAVAATHLPMPQQLSESPAYVKSIYAAEVGRLQGLLDEARALVEAI